MFCEISVKFRSASESSVSWNFGKFRTRRNSWIFCNFRFLNCLSHFKSIINENQRNYTSLEGLFANCSKLQPNLLWNFEDFVDRNCRKRQKFCEIFCFRNFRNYAQNGWPKLTETFREISVIPIAIFEYATVCLLEDPNAL